MKQIDTAYYPATQPLGQRFDATIQEAWAVWSRFLNDDYLKGVFTAQEDARALADKIRRSSQVAEVRRTWVVVNANTGEAYEISAGGDKCLQGVDLDFLHHTRAASLRNELLSRLSDEELRALGLRRA